MGSYRTRPDTTFAFASRDEARALAFMRQGSLEAGKFVGVLPRDRWSANGTPTRRGDSRDARN